MASKGAEEEEDDGWCPLLMWRMPRNESEWAQLRAMHQLDAPSTDEEEPPVARTTEKRRARQREEEAERRAAAKLRALRIRSPGRAKLASLRIQGVGLDKAVEMAALGGGETAPFGEAGEGSSQLALKAAPVDSCELDTLATCLEQFSSLER
jgi:hypothetical protein